MGQVSQIAVIFVVALQLFVSHQVGGSSQQLARLLAGWPENLSLDDVHRAVLEDQRANYIEPIRSLHTRQLTSLNGLYDFCFDPDSGPLPDEKWARHPLEASCRPGNLHRMPVPSAFNDILSNETAKNYMGWMWYQTIVTLAADRGQSDATSWLVQFQSINYAAIIWGQLVDDFGTSWSKLRLLGSHVGGHLPIVVNVSELVHSAEARSLNLRLTIAVSNMLNDNTIPSGRLVDLSSVVGHKLTKFQPDFDFFHFAGIMGDVQLLRLPQHYIKRARAITSQQANVFEFEYCLANLARGELERTLSERYHLSIGGFESASDESGGMLFSYLTHSRDDCITNELDCSRSHSSEKLCQLAQADAWPPKRSVRLRLSELIGKDKLIERDVFEMKLARGATFEQLVRRAGGQLQGFGMHHEQLFSGRTMSLPAIMKDLELLKALGANVLRTSHYPYSPAYLSACDELGLLVIAECPAVGLNSFSSPKLQLHKQMLREMMVRDHDHPSILMWSVANEPESQKPEARPYFKQLVEYARSELQQFTLGAGRPLTAALAQSHEADRVGDLLDIIMVNRYYGWYEYTGTLEAIRPALNKSLRGWAQRYGKPLLLSEFGAEAVAGMHSGELFSEQYQRDLIEQYERVFEELAAEPDKKKINFMGSMIWNFGDFSTHQTLQRVGGNKKGVFTWDRKPKMAAESVRRIYRRRAGLDAAADANSAGQSRAEL